MRFLFLLVFMCGSLSAKKSMRDAFCRVNEGQRGKINTLCYYKMTGPSGQAKDCCWENVPINKKDEKALGNTSEYTLFSISHGEVVPEVKK